MGIATKASVRSFADSAAVVLVKLLRIAARAKLPVTDDFLEPR
jgi:hypothetical protein